MGVMLDYIASGIIFGILVFTVARIQLNINESMYQNTQSVITQRNAVELARQVEFDFLKIGHLVTGQKIFHADTNRLIFKGSLLDTATPDSIIYITGDTTTARATLNPRDFALYKTINGTRITQLYGIVLFRMQFLDSVNNFMATPMTTEAQTIHIRGIKLSFMVESNEPIVRAFEDSVNQNFYTAISWEKTIFPRNLGKIYY